MAVAPKCEFAALGRSPGPASTRCKSAARAPPTLGRDAQGSIEACHRVWTRELPRTAALGARSSLCMLCWWYGGVRAGTSLLRCSTKREFAPGSSPSATHKPLLGNEFPSSRKRCSSALFGPPCGLPATRFSAGSRENWPTISAARFTGTTLPLRPLPT